MFPKPIIFLSCFNASKDLPKVQAEQYEIYQQLDDLQLTTDLIVRPTLPEAGKWMDTLSTYQSEGEILIFHFAGHASPEALLFEEKEGEEVQMFVESLANVLRERPPFLVFLNGCRTYGFVEALVEAGVSAVIGTHVNVPDHIAQRFAKRFYAELAKGKSIEQAFNFACSQPDTKKRESKVYRSQREYPGLQPANTKRKSFDWLLYGHDARSLTWQLTKQLKPRTKASLTHYLSAYSRIDVEKVVGRKWDLYSIQLLLNTHRTALLINGIGGIGKTTLAKYYLQQYESQYDHIIWVEVLPEQGEAGGDVVSAFVSEHNDILNLLELDLDPRMAEIKQFKIGMRALKKLTGTNLLIIDNAGERLEEVMRYFPQSGNWNVLITSRLRFESCKVCEVETLSQEEATHLFLTYYAEAKGDTLLPLLLSRIGYHTLTIELLAKTLAKHPRLSLPRLWERIDKEGLQAANKMKVRLDHPQFTRSIKANDCIRQLFDVAGLAEEEKHLLLQFAVLPPIPIPYALLVDFLEIHEEEEDDFIDQLENLLQKGWIRKEGSSYQCHQIIQEVTRQDLPPSVERCEILLRTLTHKLTLDETKDNPVDKFQWLPYGESLVQWIEEERIEIAMFLNCLGMMLYQKGQYNRAALLIEKGLALVEEIYGKEGESVDSFLNNLAAIYSMQGKYVEAKEMYERSLVLIIRHLGDDHPKIANNRSNLGTMLLYLGDYASAKEQFDAALTLDLQHFGANYPRVAIFRSNLSTAFRGLGNYIRAKEEIEIALAINLVHFDSEHPHIARNRSNLGSILINLGDYMGAKRELEAALAIALRNFGESHSNVASIYNNLAWVYEVTDELEKALFYFEKAYKVFLSSLPDSHPVMKKVVNNITRVKSKLNRP